VNPGRGGTFSPSNGLANVEPARVWIRDTAAAIGGKHTSANCGLHRCNLIGIEPVSALACGSSQNSPSTTQQW